MDSVIPRNIPYGVFTGLLFRRYRICTKARAFVNNAVDVADTLWKQGCVKPRLRQLFYRFLVKHRPLRYQTPIENLVRQFARGVGNFKLSRNAHAQKPAPTDLLPSHTSLHISACVPAAYVSGRGSYNGSPSDCSVGRRCLFGTGANPTSAAISLCHVTLSLNGWIRI